MTLERDLFATFGDHTYTTRAIDRRRSLHLGRIVFGPGGPDLSASFAPGVYRLSRNGSAVQIASGLRAVLGLAFDEAHRLYVLQSPIFVPGTGSLVRLDPDGSIVPIVTGLPVRARFFASRQEIDMRALGLLCAGVFPLLVGCDRLASTPTSPAALSTTPG